MQRLNRRNLKKKILSQGVLCDNDVVAMFKKGNADRNLQCTVCKRKGHSQEKCCEVTGLYPKWHYKHKPGQKNRPSRWMGNNAGVTRHANNVQGNTAEQSIIMTSQQLDQISNLIRRISSMSQKETETDEEINYGFLGMVYCNKDKVSKSME